MVANVPSVLWVESEGILDLDLYCITDVHSPIRILFNVMYSSKYYIREDSGTPNYLLK